MYDEDCEKHIAYNYFDFPALNKFLEDGWTIKDWKMKSDNSDMCWTFILKKA